jgi:hypothetical protein
VEVEATLFAIQTIGVVPEAIEAQHVPIVSQELPQGLFFRDQARAPAFNGGVAVDSGPRRDTVVLAQLFEV